MPDCGNLCTHAPFVRAQILEDTLSEQHRDRRRRHGGLGREPGPQLREPARARDSSRVCDADPQRLAKTAAQYPGVKAVGDVADVARDPDVQGVVVSASAVSHYPLAKTLLEAGKDVYVEKPLTLEVAHAEELVRLAKTKEPHPHGRAPARSTTRACST